MDFLDSIQLPEWLMTFNFDYVLAAIVLFSLIRSLFKNYRSPLRGLLWFFIPLALVLGTLFLDVATLPFLQSAIDLSGMAWIGQINVTIVSFVMDLYTSYLAGFTTMIPFGLDSLFANNAFVYLLLVVFVLGVIALLFAGLGKLMDKPKARKQDDEQVRSHSATPIRSLLVALFRNAVAIYVIYLFVTVLESQLGIDFTTGQYVMPMIANFDPIADQLIAVVTAAMGA